MRIVIALAVALMAASQFSLVQADERSEIADKVYEYVMERMEAYGSLREPKVMAICVDWDAPTASGINVQNAFVTYTAESSDKPIFPTSLAANAKHRCKQWAKSEKIGCTCQMLDLNGTNVLKVPPRM